jgi:hypothetical protein
MNSREDVCDGPEKIGWKQHHPNVLCSIEERRPKSLFTKALGLTDAERHFSLSLQHS